MNGCELIASISAFASLLASRLSDSELALTAAVFTQLGDTLATLSVQKELCQSAKQAGQERENGGTEEDGVNSLSNRSG